MQRLYIATSAFFVCNAVINVLDCSRSVSSFKRLRCRVNELVNELSYLKARFPLPRCASRLRALCRRYYHVNQKQL